MNEANELAFETSSDGAFVTVGRFNDPAGAHMARSAVEAAGIQCMLESEVANSLIPVAFRARLVVAPADEAAARAVLETADFTPFSESEVLAAEQQDEQERAAAGTDGTASRS